MHSRQPVGLVTGASGGFGQLIAQRLSQDGFRTFGTSRSGNAPAGCCANSAPVEMLPLDVRSDRSVAACIQQIQACAGRIDVVVNNAGILDICPAEERTIEEIKSIFETNFFGVVRVTHAVLPIMRQQGFGRIINMSSLAGLLAPPGEAIYAASKFALEGYSESLSYEVAPFNIQVSLIEPGFFRTNIKASVPQLAERISAYSAFRETLRAAFEKSIENGSDPEIVARLVSKIVSSKRPKLRYRVGQDAVYFPYLRRLVPERVYERALRKRLGIDTSL